MGKTSLKMVFLVTLMFSVLGTYSCIYQSLISYYMFTSLPANDICFAGWQVSSLLGDKDPLVNQQALSMSNDKGSPCDSDADCEGGYICKIGKPICCNNVCECFCGPPPLLG